MHTLQILPASFCTMHFIKKTLQKDSFYLLYIYDSYVKLLHIHQGFYRDIQKVNIGSDMLKQIYQDNGIFEYFYASGAEIKEQPLIRDIVYQSVDFFTQMLSKRLGDYIAKENDLILISSLTKNICFQEKFNERYNHYINGYILPFHSSTQLEKF